MPRDKKEVEREIEEGTKSLEVAKKVKYALLDEAGVILSYTKKKPSKQMLGLYIEVPLECDLEPEKYRWDKEEKTFVLTRHINDPMDPYNPIAKALIDIRDSRLIDFNDETLLWLRRYE